MGKHYTDAEAIKSELRNFVDMSRTGLGIEGNRSCSFEETRKRIKYKFMREIDDIFCPN